MNRIIAFCILCVLSPAFVVMALLVMIDSGRPVIFTQVRNGKAFKPFRIYKFRTMRSCDNHTLTLENDKRVTKVGRILRKHKLDELPQLWNIIKGDMNWIGPRPEQPFYVEQIICSDERNSILYSVKPGLSSLGVVEYGYAKDLPEMLVRLDYDLYYLKNASPSLKLYIISKTIKIMFNGETKKQR